MHATEVIESYINDTVRLLPRRQRDDVATELRSLLNEELRAQAGAQAIPTVAKLQGRRVFREDKTLSARYNICLRLPPSLRGFRTATYFALPRRFGATQ
jgi:hypothetical protein